MRGVGLTLPLITHEIYGREAAVTGNIFHKYRYGQYLNPQPGDLQHSALTNAPLKCPQTST